MESLPITVRPAGKADVPFITSSWLRNYRDAPAVRGIPNNIFYHNHHKVLERLLPKSMVFVACNAEDLNQIVGWACAEVVDDALVLHFMYTKGPARRWGVARKILESLVEAFMAGKGYRPKAMFYTHKTLLTPKLLSSKRYQVIFNPYLAVS